jgi:hypothetical protein
MKCPVILRPVARRGLRIFRLARATVSQYRVLLKRLLRRRQLRRKLVRYAGFGTAFVSLLCLVWVYLSAEPALPVGFYVLLFFALMAIAETFDFIRKERLAALRTQEEVITRLLDEQQRTQQNTFNPAPFVQSCGLPSFPVHGLDLVGEKLERLMHRQSQIAPGASKRDYLRVIDGQVRAVMKYQLENGRIEDPVDPANDYYATPCFAHSVAALYRSGYNTDPDVLESGWRAMDRALRDMGEKRPMRNPFNISHYDFFTFPLVLAFRLYSTISSPEKVRGWTEKIAAIDPYSLYHVLPGPEANNWNVFNLAGEYLRSREGFTSIDYVEESLRHQIGHFTPLGMYVERGNPLPYEQQVRYLLAAILRLGYCGRYFEQMRDKVCAGTWLSLLMQSPTGDFPTGYRSSHHLWNEAQAVGLYEIMAAQYARCDRMAEAEVFKRAARLSFGVVDRWIRPDGSGCIVKNWYPIARRHGYEQYSTHTTYNMLACSALALAWESAEDSVSEGVAPADTGGFVLPLLQPFRKVYANAGGTFVEYDTGGDREKRQYNPTGLIRVHFRGIAPELGPSDGCAPFLSGKDINLAVGPAWRARNGQWHTLAEMRPSPPTVEVLHESAEKVAVEIRFPELRLEDSDAPVSVTETVTLQEDSVTIRDQVSGLNNGIMQIRYPMLVFDGSTDTEIVMHGNSVTLRRQGLGVKFTVVEPQNQSLRRSGIRIPHRNGLVEMAYTEVEGTTATYTITASR